MSVERSVSIVKNFSREGGRKKMVRQREVGSSDRVDPFEQTPLLSLKARLSLEKLEKPTLRKRTS